MDISLALVLVVQCGFLLCLENVSDRTSCRLKCFKGKLCKFVRYAEASVREAFVCGLF